MMYAFDIFAQSLQKYKILYFDFYVFSLADLKRINMNILKVLNLELAY